MMQEGLNLFSKQSRLGYVVSHIFGLVIPIESMIQYHLVTYHSCKFYNISSNALCRSSFSLHRGSDWCCCFCGVFFKYAFVNALVEIYPKTSPENLFDDGNYLVFTDS